VSPFSTHKAIGLPFLTLPFSWMMSRMSYFFSFLLAPRKPSKSQPMRSMVAGSGTEAGPLRGMRGGGRMLTKWLIGLKIKSA
jgi:hypothetical protein